VIVEVIFWVICLFIAYIAGGRAATSKENQ
jgi:hypothetical protein